MPPDRVPLQGTNMLQHVHTEDQQTACNIVAFDSLP
jgi:hypothetical protein